MLPAVVDTEEGKWHLAEVEQVHSAAVASERLVVDCRRVGWECRRSFAAAWEVAGVEAVQGSSSPGEYGPDAALSLTTAATCWVAAATVLVGIVEYSHCASAATAAACRA